MFIVLVYQFIYVEFIINYFKLKQIIDALLLTNNKHNLYQFLLLIFTQY